MRLSFLIPIPVDDYEQEEPSDKPFPISFPFLACLFVLFMILMVTTGCSPVLSGRADSQALPGTILFSDDFSNPRSGWGIWNRDGAAVEYHKGGLRIQVNENQYDFWSVAGKNYSDVQIELDATRIGGPADNDFGAVCRYQNKDNFYMLVISSDGYYGIAKMKDGRYSMIGAQQLQYSQSIADARDEEAVHLRADCIGSTLRLYANDQLLAETQDSDFQAGDVGVLAGAYNGNGVDILFDNFVVKKP